MAEKSGKREYAIASNVCLLATVWILLWQGSADHITAATPLLLGLGVPIILGGLAAFGLHYVMRHRERMKGVDQ